MSGFRNWQEMESHIVETRCPIVREETLNIARLVDQTGLFDYKLMRFPYKIKWVRSSESFYEKVIDGETLFQSDTHNDFFGLLTSSRDLVDRAKATSELRGHDATHPLEYLVITVLRDTPYIDLPPEKIPPHMGLTLSAFLPVFADWMVDDLRIEDWMAMSVLERSADDAFRPTYVRDTALSREFVVWSSHSTEEGNAKASESIMLYRDGRPLMEDRL